MENSITKRQRVLMTNGGKRSLLKIIPIAGWIFIVYGLLIPLEFPWLLAAWYLDIILTLGIHAIQLFWSIPIGKKMGHSVSYCIFMTMLWGATWWKRVHLK